MSFFFRFFIILCFLGFSPVQGVVYLYNFNTEYSGASTPQGPTPWLTARIADVPGNKVQIDLTASNLVGSEFVSKWHFNYSNPSNLNSLIFNKLSGTVSTDPTINLGSEKYKGGGGGKYDIQFSFPTSNKSDRFNSGDSISYEVMSQNPISAEMFNLLSSPQGGNGTYFSSAHVQGIGQNAEGSGWVGSSGGDVPVPEPGTILIITSMAGVSYYLRKKRAGGKKG